MAARPGVLGRGRSSVMARLCPALHCRMRSAWRSTGERVELAFIQFAELVKKGEGDR